MALARQFLIFSRDDARYQRILSERDDLIKERNDLYDDYSSVLEDPGAGVQHLERFLENFPDDPRAQAIRFRLAQQYRWSDRADAAVLELTRLQATASPDTVEAAEEVMHEAGVRVKYMVGTMIELPRAALTADEIAREAEFFSYGTNDLTQTTFGLSRDDAGKFLPMYVESKVLPADPFVTIDRAGVGELVRIAVEKGRRTRPDIKIGICGEHGGDPASVGFCHQIGLDYVSCSPYRVPVARLAAARAALED